MAFSHWFVFFWSLPSNNKVGNFKEWKNQKWNKWYNEKIWLWVLLYFINILVKEVESFIKKNDSLLCDFELFLIKNLWYKESTHYEYFEWRVCNKKETLLPMQSILEFQKDFDECSELICCNNILLKNADDVKKLMITTLTYWFLLSFKIPSNNNGHNIKK